MIYYAYPWLNIFNLKLEPWTLMLETPTWKTPLTPPNPKTIALKNKYLQAQ
jgi:hypothetical protein